MVEFKSLVSMDVWAGFFGALLAAFMGHGKSVKERLIGFAVGFAFALFLTEPTLTFFKLSSTTYGGGAGFVLGFFGMTMADAVMNTDWRGIIKARFGGGA